MRHLASILFIATVVLLAPTQPARAGSYGVAATCGPWHAVDYSDRIAIYPSCPTLTVRNVQGNMTTPEGAQAAWIFEAPPGTGLEHATLSGTMIGVSGWQATIYLQGGSSNGVAVENCPGAACPGGSRVFDHKLFGAGLANAIIARVRCGRAGGCYNGAQSGGINLWQSTVRIFDGSPPAVAAEGTLAAPGWKGSTVPVSVVASDNVGIKQTRVLVDGVPRATAARNCNYATKVPCPNGADTLAVPLGGVPDGQHTLTVQAIDSADNLGGADRPIYVDNTAPTAPIGAAIEGGPGWRAANRWSITWTNPPQRFAPIAAADFRICPAAADSSDPKVAARASKQCVSDSRRGAGITRIDDLTVPDPGDWTLQLSLRDSAGNRDPDTASKLTGLGFDPSPPGAMSFARQDPADPARLRVNAVDPDSGIASGAIEVRRRGARAWRPLATQVTEGGISALADDEVLRKGLYFARAVAVNRAGLQHGTRVRENGRRARLRLPVRSPARVQAGRFLRRCKTKRHCRYEVDRRIAGNAKRRTLIRGRLRSRGRPLAHQKIEVWRRLAMASSEWTRVGTKRTGRSGRFRYRAPRGPAARIRFRFPGGPLIRGDNAVVKLRVPARTSLRVSRRNVVNGEYVTFRGRVKRAWIPAEGTLVELQVFTRRRWRTFAQPRAAADTGSWEYQYRFEAIRGDVSFPFRARIRKQSNYPFDTGHSRTVRVRVRGL